MLPLEHFKSDTEIYSSIQKIHPILFKTWIEKGELIDCSTICLALYLISSLQNNKFHSHLIPVEAQYFATM